MGRVVNRLATYYWLSKETGRRVGWFHPSRLSANKWKRAKYYKFVDYPLLEDYLKTHSKDRHTYETIVWNRHMNGFNDLVLRKAVILT